MNDFVKTHLYHILEAINSINEYIGKPRKFKNYETSMINKFNTKKHD